MAGFSRCSSRWITVSGPLDTREPRRARSTNVPRSRMRQIRPIAGHDPVDGGSAQCAARPGSPCGDGNRDGEPADGCSVDRSSSRVASSGRDGRPIPRRRPEPLTEPTSPEPLPQKDWAVGDIADQRTLEGRPRPRQPESRCCRHRPSQTVSTGLHQCDLPTLSRVFPPRVLSLCTTAWAVLPSAIQPLEHQSFTRPIPDDRAVVHCGHQCATFG